MEQPTLFADLTDPAPPPSAAPAAPPAGEPGPGPASDGAPVLLALDGNSLAHRAYHAYERSGMTARSDGRPVFATYGFFALFAGIADKVGPDAVVVGFDSTESVRKQRWPHYKANRSPAPDALYAQMDEIRELLTEIGVHVAVVDGWEADDVVASAAARAEAAGRRCVVATSDRDSFALISERTTVLRLGSGLDNATWMTPERLAADYGVRPDQYLHFAALRGDPSDNLPGVRGIGAKTAQKLLAAMTVDEALTDPEAAAALLGPSAARKLVDGEEAYRHNLEVMALRRDLDVDVAGARLEVDGAHVGRVLHTHEVPSVAPRLVAALSAAGRNSGDRAPAGVAPRDASGPF